MSFVIPSDKLTNTALLIKKRIFYIKNVASYKFQKNLPVQNVNQEKKVLENSLNTAKDLGINPSSIEKFILVQMNVAKAIQYRYFADWLSKPILHEKQISLEEIQSNIDNTNNNIIKEIACFLKSGENIDNSFKKSFFNIVTHPNVKSSDKEILFSSLKLIELNK